MKISRITQKNLIKVIILMLVAIVVSRWTFTLFYWKLDQTHFQEMDRKIVVKGLNAVTTNLKNSPIKGEDQIISNGEIFNIIKYFATGWNGVDVKNSSVCLATHSSLNKVYWIAQTTRLWGGIISVAVYSTPDHIKATQRSIEMLRKCSPKIKYSVTFKLVYKYRNTPNTLHESDISEINCDDFISIYVTQLLEAEKYMKEEIYPQNLMRNIARSTCPTSHTLNVDIDMIPNKGLSEKLNDFFKRTRSCSKCAYLIPIYEISKDSKFPPFDKAELLKMIKRNESQRYHIKVYSGNQGNSNLKMWENLVGPSTTELNILYRIPMYREFWEPIMVLPSEAPLFEEIFVGYGYTRNSHVYHMNVLKFKFDMLDNGFLSHLGFQTRALYSQTRMRQLKNNSKQYIKFKKYLKNRLKS